MECSVRSCNMATVKYKQGDRVFNTHFGRGTVIEVMTDGSMKVYFAGFGIKTFDMNYAQFRPVAFEDENEEYTNKAFVLYVHHGHESHVVLQIGQVCLPAHMYQSTDLYYHADGQGEFPNIPISVNLTIYNASLEPYEPTEDNPMFGIHEGLWKDGLIGKINVSTEVSVRRPDSMTNSPFSPVDWGSVIVEGFGEVFDLDDDEDPVITSCGVLFYVDMTHGMNRRQHFKKGDLVAFKGRLIAFESE